MSEEDQAFWTLYILAAGLLALVLAWPYLVR